MRLALLALAACGPPAPALPRATPASYDVGRLHVDGAPPLDPAIASELAGFAAVAQTRLLDVSDDGRDALVLAGRDAVEIRDGRAIRRVAGFDVAWARFAGSSIYVAADRDGDEQFALFRQHGDREPMLFEEGRHTDLVLGRNRRWLAWTTNEPPPGGVDDIVGHRHDVRDLGRDELWIADALGGKSLAYAGDGQWSTLDVSVDGSVALARRTVSATQSALYRIDVRARTATALTPVARDVAATAGVLADDGTVYAACTCRGDVAQLWALGAHAVPLAPDLAWEVSAVALSPDGATLAFVTNEDGAGVLHLLDTRTRLHRVAPGAPTGGVIADLRFARVAPVLAFSFSSPAQPRAAFAYHLDTAATTAWLPAAIAPHPVEPSRVEIRRGDVRIPALVYRPARTPAPVVVELHGGPEDQWLPRYAGFDQFLVARGYAIVQPNVRGSAGYGQAFLGLDDGPRRADAVADVGAVLDWIATQPELDARRVVVMGQSYGGYLALASVLAFPDRLRGGIDLSGIADFVAFLEGTQPSRRDLRRAEYGDERDPATRATLAQLSPIAHAAEIRRPLLVAHGTRDPRVPARDAERLVDAVRAAGQPVWYLAAADEGHGFTKSANRGVLEVLIAQFLDAVTRAR